MSRQLGTLAVVVLKARNLPNKSLWKQSPYCVSRFEGGGQQTKIDERGGQHPVWDDEFRFNVVDNGEAKRFIKFSIFTKESRIDDLIGEAQLDIMEHDILRKGEFDDWIKLKNGARETGEIYVEITFYSAAPPLARRPSKLSPHDRLWRPPQTPPKTPSPSRSPASAPQYLPVPGQEPQPPPRRGDLPPAPNQRLHKPTPPVPAPPIKNDLPPAAHQRLHRDPNAPPPQQQQQPAGSPPTSPPRQTRPLGGEPRPISGDFGGAPPAAPSGGIAYRPPAGIDDFMNAPAMPAAQPYRPAQQQPALHAVPSILRPGHVRQNPSAAAAAGADAARRAAQEEEDARMAAELAQAEGIDIEWLRKQEQEAELARRMGQMPGGYN